MTAEMFRLSNGLNIQAELIGTGPLMLCLSGFANTNYNFKLLAPHLASNFQLCMINARGMGDSDAAPAEYEMTDLAHDAFEIAQILGANKFNVCGISLGGYPAQLMAMKYPEQVKNLVLIATRGPGKAYKVIRAVTEEGLRAFMTMDSEQANRMAITSFVHPSFITDHPEQLDKIILLRQKENKIGLDQSLMQLRAGYKFVESEMDMSKIVAPTLIIAGDEDCFLPKQNAELLHAQIKGSELVFIPETSHLCFLEKPAQLAAHILGYMRGHHE